MLEPTKINTISKYLICKALKHIDNNFEQLANKKEGQEKIGCWINNDELIVDVSFLESNLNEIETFKKKIEISIQKIEKFEKVPIRVDVYQLRTLSRKKNFMVKETLVFAQDQNETKLVDVVPDFIRNFFFIIIIFFYFIFYFFIFFLLLLFFFFYFFFFFFYFFIIFFSFFFVHAGVEPVNYAPVYKHYFKLGEVNTVDLKEKWNFDTNSYDLIDYQSFQLEKDVTYPL